MIKLWRKYIYLWMVLIVTIPLISYLVNDMVTNDRSNIEYSRAIIETTNANEANAYYDSVEAILYVNPDVYEVDFVAGEQTGLTGQTVNINHNGEINYDSVNMMPNFIQRVKVITPEVETKGLLPINFSLDRVPYQQINPRFRLTNDELEYEGTWNSYYIAVDNYQNFNKYILPLINLMKILRSYMVDTILILSILATYFILAKSYYSKVNRFVGLLINLLLINLLIYLTYLYLNLSIELLQITLWANGLLVPTYLRIFKYGPRCIRK